MSRFLVFLAAVGVSACAIVTFADDKAPKDSADQKEPAEGAAEKTPVDPEIERLKSKPDDATAIQQYVLTQFQSLGRELQKDPDAVVKRLKAMSEAIASLEPTTDEGKAVKQQMARAIEQASKQVEQRVESTKRLKALEGTEAAPLKADAWVNGEPLKDEDLKGKVVLLDFWAVWCGPCIMTFPHLREWHEKYSDKGLVIVGLTQYYKYKWDDKAGKAVPSGDSVSHEDEQEMLKKFAEEHELKHRIAVNTDRELSKHYLVSGIPHVVVIGRDNKVKLVKVGAGEETAKAIEAAIEECIKEGA